MLSSNSKRAGLNWATLCLILSLIFFFVAGTSISFACSKTCKSKSSSQTCAGHSEATSENQQSAPNPQTAKKQAELSGEESSTTVTPVAPKFTIKEKYTCPMHPEAMKGKAGKCPKCGMNLEKKEFYEVYTCPMKDCPYMSEKGGKCSCGMKLKKKLISKDEYEKLSQPQ